MVVLKLAATTAAFIFAILPSAKGAIAELISPFPTVCDAPARTRDDIMSLLGNSDIAIPSATTSGQTIDSGTPATAIEAAAMKSVVMNWLACQNAGEPLRAWSLFTDGYLYRLLSRQGGLAEASYDGLATPTPSSSEPAELLEFEGARILPDGRRGATVTLGYPSIPMPKRFFFYFARENNHLLIDGILGEISFSVP